MKVRSTNPDAFLVFYPYTKQVTNMGQAFSSDYMKVKPFEVRTDILSLTTQKAKGGAGSWSVTLGSRLNYRSIIQPGNWVMIHMLDKSIEITGTRTNGSHEETGFKMLGIVRSVRCVETTDPNSGTRTTRFVISGDDFHSVMDSQVYLCPILRPPGDTATNPVIDSLVLFKKQFDKPLTPDEMVKTLIETILGKQESLNDALVTSGAKAGGIYGIPSNVATRLTGKSAPDSKFVNILQFLFHPKLAGLIYLQPDLGSLFTLWSMVQSYSHSILNEVFTDLFPVKTPDGSIRLLPSVIMRPIPFTVNPPSVEQTEEAKKQDAEREKTATGTTGAAQTLPYLRIKDTAARTAKDLSPNLSNGFYTSKFIEEEEIMGLNYGKSDAERFNFFFVSSNLMNQMGLAANNLYPLLKASGNTRKDENGNVIVSASALGDPNSILRHGLRPYITQSQYMNIRAFDVVGVNNLVRDMWGRAHLFENGSVVLVGQHYHIPVGTNIEFVERGWIAHVEQVSHSFNVAPNGRKTYRTTINFVRLQKKNGKPLDLSPTDEPLNADMPRVAMSKNGEGYDQGITSVTDYTYGNHKGDGDEE